MLLAVDLDEGKTSITTGGRVTVWIDVQQHRRLLSGCITGPQLTTVGAIRP